MKSFIYFLSILALGCAGELKGDNTAPTPPANNSESGKIQIDQFYNTDSLFEEISTIISGNSEDNKTASDHPMSKQEFNVLVRKHILEQKKFLRYMQATSISLTFLMTAISIIMGRSLIREWKD